MKNNKKKNTHKRPVFRRRQPSSGESKKNVACTSDSECCENTIKLHKIRFKQWWKKRKERKRQQLGTAAAKLKNKRRDAIQRCFPSPHAASVLSRKPPLKVSSISAQPAGGVILGFFWRRPRNISSCEAKKLSAFLVYVIKIVHGYGNMHLAAFLITYRYNVVKPANHKAAFSTSTRDSLRFFRATS